MKIVYIQPTIPVIQSGLNYLLQTGTNAEFIPTTKPQIKRYTTKEPRLAIMANREPKIPMISMIMSTFFGLYNFNIKGVNALPVKAPKAKNAFRRPSHKS